MITRPLLVLILALSSLSIFLTPNIGSAGQVTLAWDMNNEPNVAGYKIYYGKASRNYDWFIDVGNVTQVTITDLPNGSTYYFAATAYDNSNPPIESTYSDEVNKDMCTYSISQTNASFSASGGTGSVSVTTQPGCTWTASSGASWLTITSGKNGTGNGVISYSVSANTNTDARTASSTFAGKVFTVAQSGAATYTIRASASQGGIITPSGSVTVAKGANQSFTATPNAGYQVSYVAIDGVPQEATSSYTFSNVTKDHTIAAVFSVKTYTINASAGSGGSISPSGNTSVNHGANQSYVISPNNGFTIADVIVDGVSQGATGPYIFSNVTSNHTISAVFKVNSFTITVSAGPGGTISPSESISVPNGGSQTFTILPDTSHAISDVLVDGSSVGAVSSYTFRNVTGDHTIYALFVPGYTLSITTSGTGSGHVVAHPLATVYAPGTKITLKAIAGEGSNFGGFSGDCESNRSKCTLIMNQHAEINAAFEQKNFKLIATAIGNGSISVEGLASIKNKKIKNKTKIKRSKQAITVSYGSQLVYHINPEPEHYIKKIIVNGKPIEAVDTLTFANIKRNHRVRVRFESQAKFIQNPFKKTIAKQAVLQDIQDRDISEAQQFDSYDTGEDTSIPPPSYTDQYASLQQ